ncbi:MAG: hypothetical protein ABH842_01820 [Candidatus Micrarchaeota archaeon]
MAKKKGKASNKKIITVAKEADKFAKEMGVKMFNINATKITIETAEKKKIVLDPIRCTSSVMEGYEEYGYSFQISAKLKSGKIV